MSWNLNDLTTAAGAPVAVGDPAGYMFAVQNTQHVVYRGTDNHIHELYNDAGGWHHNDLTTAAYQTLPSYYGIPLAAGDPVGYMFDSQQTQHVVYRGANNLIHELRWDSKGWHLNFLTDAVDAPPVAGNPTGYVFAAQGTQHVIYRGSDGNIHELWWSNDGWHHSSLTTVTDAPLAASDPAAYMFDAQNTQHVVYLGGDGHIHELYNTSNGWYHNDLTDSTNSPATVGNPAGYMFAAQNTQHVVYRGTDNHIHELYWAAGDVNTGYLGLDMEYQQQDNWCWSATTVSITKRYNTASPWTQATLVNKAFGVTTACLDPSSKGV